MPPSRDPSIERKTDPAVGRDDLRGLVKKAVQVAPKSKPN